MRSTALRRSARLTLAVASLLADVAIRVGVPPLAQLIRARIHPLLVRH